MYKPLSLTQSSDYPGLIRGQARANYQVWNLADQALADARILSELTDDTANAGYVDGCNARIQIITVLARSTSPSARRSSD